MNIPFVGGVATLPGPGTGWVRSAKVSVPSGVSTQSFTVALNGTTIATITGDQTYGPLALVGNNVLTITANGGSSGQQALVEGSVYPYAPVPPTQETGLPWFNVVDYGADPTGQQDSTATIQAALNAANSGRVLQQTVVDHRDDQTRDRHERSLSRIRQARMTESDETSRHRRTSRCDKRTEFLGVDVYVHTPRIRWTPGITLSSTCLSRRRYIIRAP